MSTPSLPPLHHLSLHSPSPNTHNTPEATDALAGGKRKRRPRTEAAGVVIFKPTEEPGALDSYGVASFPLSIEESTSEFVAILRQCTNKWFHLNFELMLSKPIPAIFRVSKTNEPKLKIINSWKAWNTLSVNEQRAYMSKIDLKTDEGMALVFNSDVLKKRSWFQTMKGAAFFQKTIQVVKQGNTNYGEANMAESWSAKGFGKWAHIVPDIAIPMVIETMKTMERFGLQPGLPEHFPHALYKPPSGKPLEIHHDQKSSLGLIADLRTFVASTSNPTTTEWIKRHGLQCLAHLQGGTGINDGATFVVGPMTPPKLLICLDAYSSGRLGGDYEEWNKQSVRKIDLPWEDHLDQFNAILQQRGYERIGLIPAAPLGKALAKKGFLLVFPVGWPHGSFANSSNESVAAGKGSRITLTQPITMRSSGQVPDVRIPTRLQNMATISTPGLSSDAYASAEAWLAQDTKVYADGSTHMHPEKIADMIRCPDAASVSGERIGPYHSISVKMPTVENYIRILHKVKQGLSLLDDGSGASMPEAPAPVPVMPPEVPPEGPTSPDSSGDESDEDDDVPFAQRLRRAEPAPAPPPLPPPRPPPPPTTLVRPRGWHVPPTAQVLDDDVKIYKVDQPYASALVLGHKDVENRDKPLKSATGFPVWMIIASNKPKPTKAVMLDYYTKMRAEFPKSDPMFLEPEDLLPQTILGMVRVMGCYQEAEMPWNSVWYNGAPSYAWVIDDAWEFETPIPLVPDDGMQTNVRLANRPAYRARIEEELAKLVPGYR